MLLALALLLSTCMVHSVHSTGTLDADARWILLPMLNHSQAPQAGERAEALLQTLLRTAGVANIYDCTNLQNGHKFPELNEKRRFSKALSWAKKHHYTYGITGSVEEWRYRGLDGQPAAGISIRVIDLKTDKVVFAASGSDSGWGRDTVSGTAQKLLRKLVVYLKLEH